MSNAHSRPETPPARRGLIAAAIGVGVIALVGTVVGVTATATGGPTVPPTDRYTGTHSPVTSDDDRSICGLQMFETQSSLTKAPETTWELVGTVAAPTDPTAGPGQISSSGLRSCFAHTATGALFASVNYIALGSDARTLPYLPQLVEPGPGRDAAEAAASPEVEPSSARLQVAGFKVNSYTAHEAVIDVAWTVTSSGNQLVSFPMVMHWVNGDWMLSLTPAGQPPFSSSPLASLGGYIPWAGV